MTELIVVAIIYGIVAIVSAIIRIPKAYPDVDAVFYSIFIECVCWPIGLLVNGTYKLIELSVEKKYKS